MSARLPTHLPVSLDIHKRDLQMQIHWLVGCRRHAVEAGRKPPCCITAGLERCSATAGQSISGRRAGGTSLGWQGSPDAAIFSPRKCPPPYWYIHTTQYTTVAEWVVVQLAPPQRDAEGRRGEPSETLPSHGTYPKVLTYVHVRT
jgi:hypothetical protein